jgi:cytochrome c-type biogenesis protein CcmH/NrfG
MKKSSEIVCQLRGIKRTLIAGALCFAGLLATNIYYVWDDIQENKERRLGRTFSDQADSLLREQEWEELLTLAQARQQSRPRDPAGYLFAGIAFMHKDELGRAKAEFEKTVEIQPYMKKTVGQWMKALKEKQAEKAKKK